MAWDLAGAVVEWGLDDGGRGALLDAYERASGDRAAPRLPAFEQAYLLSQCARARMAAGLLAGTPEQERMVRAYVRYRRMLARCVGS